MRGFAPELHVVEAKRMGIASWLYPDWWCVVFGVASELSLDSGVDGNGTSNVSGVGTTHAGERL
jgi:hypothetical protein